MELKTFFLVESSDGFKCAINPDKVVFVEARPTRTFECVLHCVDGYKLECKTAWDVVVGWLDEYRYKEKGGDIVDFRITECSDDVVDHIDPDTIEKLVRATDLSAHVHGRSKGYAREFPASDATTNEV